MALYLHLLGSPAGVNVSSSSTEASPTWINKMSNGKWQIVIAGPVLKEGRVLCPWMARLLCCAADSRELVSTETAILDHKDLGTASSTVHVGFFPFSPGCLVLQLLIFLLSCSCSYVSWLLVLVFVSQAFTDFHLPSLFYSSVIDSCPVPSYCCIHSQVLHSFPSLLHLSFPYLLPHSLQMLFCFWFHHHPCFQSPSS